MSQLRLRNDHGKEKARYFTRTYSEITEFPGHTHKQMHRYHLKLIGDGKIINRGVAF